MSKMIQHHEKYEEIHGEDKIVMMTRSDHIKLHKKLRKEGGCNIPAKELHNIASAGYNRTHQRIRFFDTVAPNIGLIENVLYNNNTGNIQYNSYFEASNGKKLIYMDL